MTVLLAAFLGVFAAERTAELLLSARNMRALPPGAREFGRAHFPMFVVLHTAYPLALVFEVMRLGARPAPGWPVWLAMWFLAQALRVWAIASLGRAWNVRIWVVPGTAPIRRGAYRWLRHPNYVAVSLELFAGALMFGAWRVALGATALNALALAIRIPEEERALRWAAEQAPETAPGAH